MERVLNRKQFYTTIERRKRKSEWSGDESKRHKTKSLVPSDKNQDVSWVRLYREFHGRVSLFHQRPGRRDHRSI